MYSDIGILENYKGLLWRTVAKPAITQYDAIILGFGTGRESSGECAVGEGQAHRDDRARTRGRNLCQLWLYSDQNYGSQR